MTTPNPEPATVLDASAQALNLILWIAKRDTEPLAHRMRHLIELASFSAQMQLHLLDFIKATLEYPADGTTR